MRRLHVISSVNPAAGGPVEGIKQIARVTEQLGFPAEVVTLDAPDSPWLKDFPLPVYALGPSKSAFIYTKRLIPWLKENASRYDAVVVNGLWQFQGYGTYLALRNTKIPYFVFSHGMLDPWFNRTYPLKHLKKLLYWFWGEYRVLKNAKAVCFTSEEERQLARESFRPYECTEVVVNYGTAGPPPDVPAEVQTEEFFAENPDLRGKRMILFLSRIHVKKGCDLLIEAFAQVAQQDPRLHLVMAGPDKTGWRPELERLAEKHGIKDRISWPGMLSGNKKWGAFRASEAFILPSHQENFGIVVAEALACGTPVLITDKVNIWREIEGDGAGIVEPDTAEGVLHLLTRWLGLSESERSAMQAQTLVCFRSRFEIQKAAESLIRVLSSSGKEVVGGSRFVG